MSVVTEYLIVELKGMFDMRSDVLSNIRGNDMLSCLEGMLEHLFLMIGLAFQMIFVLFS
jgi:hypothetical protein